MAKAIRKVEAKEFQEVEFQEAEVESKSIFNPEKRYRWTPEDKFELTGVEFAILLNQVLERKQKLLQEIEITNILEAKLKEAVATGIATEIPEDPMIKS